MMSTVAALLFTKLNGTSAVLATEWITPTSEQESWLAPLAEKESVCGRGVTEGFGDGRGRGRGDTEGRGVGVGVGGEYVCVGSTGTSAGGRVDDCRGRTLAAGRGRRVCSGAAGGAVVPVPDAETVGDLVSGRTTCSRRRFTDAWWPDPASANPAVADAASRVPDTAATASGRHIRRRARTRRRLAATRPNGRRSRSAAIRSPPAAPLKSPPAAIRSAPAAPLSSSPAALLRSATRTGSAESAAAEAAALTRARNSTAEGRPPVSLARHASARGRTRPGSPFSSREPSAMRVIRVAEDLPQNGSLPVAAKASTTPRLYISLAGPTAPPSACSGDMKPGEPTMKPAIVSGVASDILQIPKSITRGPSAASSTFDGFRSLCTKPAAWIAARPSASPAASDSTESSDIGPHSRTAWASEGPAT